MLLPLEIMDIPHRFSIYFEINYKSCGWSKNGSQRNGVGCGKEKEK
jgi:hypothetical protein